MARVLCIPYKGSKAKIAEEIASIMPKGKAFYDLFAGGGAMTTAAMQSGKFRRFVLNDITEGLTEMYVNAVNGKYRDETRWISREEFRRLAPTDPYVRFCWSFGNNGQDYMYAEQIEPWKKALHYAAVFGDYSLMERMGITPPHSDAATPNERKIEIGRWCNAHRAEVKARYIKYWLSLVDEKKRHYEEIYGYVLRGENVTLKCEEERERLRSYLLAALKDSGLTQAEVGRRLGNQMQGHYFGRSQWEFPTYEEYCKMQRFMPALTADYYELTQYMTILQSLQRLESLQRLQRLERLQSLESLQRLQRLQRLQSLQRLESLQSSYDEVEITEAPGECVVYCDPPYKGTDGYSAKHGGDEGFDHERFYDWLRKSPHLVYVSEYAMPDDFVCVWQKAHRSLLRAVANTKVTEKVFVHKSKLHLHPRKQQPRELDMFGGCWQEQDE